MNPMYFVIWLEQELQERGWSRACLACQGHISAAQVTRVLNREQNPGLKFYTAVAVALHIPVSLARSKASCLPQFK